MGGGQPTPGKPIGLEGGTPALSGLVGQLKRALCAKEKKIKRKGKKGRRWEGRGTPSHQTKSNSVWGGSPPPLGSADSLGGSLDPKARPPSLLLYIWSN